MKIPLRWLRDYVDITLPEAQLIERLTLAGLEVASTKVHGLPIPQGVRVKAEDRGPVWDTDKIVVAQITRIEKHPDADRLKLPIVTWGPGTEKTLVTGAPNVAVGQAGQKVVLALAGSKLFDGHSDERVIKELKPSKIRGVPSDAMVCSLLELGVSDNKADHEGIILLEDDAPVGMPLADFMGDIVLEVDVLPNMARCLAMIGVAREVAAITGQSVKLPADVLTDNGAPVAGQFTVAIEDAKLCARYAGLLIRNVTIGAAPGWMQRRLLYAGMRPINNIVDITNYVMLEWGQPLHAFDYDVLVKRAAGKAPAIMIRPARPGETLVTLDNQKRELTADHLVIADAAGPIALAGVMGGLETEVTASTKNILLESANFDGVSIRRTFHHFNLPSEASQRFSRGIHPETVAPAGRRAAELMRQFADGTVAKGVVDCYPAPLPPQVVQLKMDDVRRTLGTPDLPQDDAVRILKALEFDVVVKDQSLQATVPPHRVDIQEGPADLIEEIARIYGYDRLPATLLADRLPRQVTNEALVFEDKLRDLLVHCGLQEVICYSLTTPEREVPLLGDGTGYVRLKNPISNERSVMRRSVLASVLEVAANNLRNVSDLRLFEVGSTYVPKSGAALPDEPRRLAFVMTGSRRQPFWNDSSAAAAADGGLDFFDLKGVVETIARDLHLPAVGYQASKAAHLHPGRSATLLSGNTSLGDFGQLHPLLTEKLGLGDRTILVGEFDLAAVQVARPPRFSYVPVARFPAALRDIAVVVDDALSGEHVVAEIKAAGGDLLRGVRLFDVYKGSGIPDGKKSLAFALSYQADDRTLADKELDRAHKKIEDRLKHTLKALIRGKDCN
jgi:phenylalanyl-tRNA synthetase beta chain